MTRLLYLLPLVSVACSGGTDDTAESTDAADTDTDTDADADADTDADTDTDSDADTDTDTDTDTDVDSATDTGGTTDTGTPYRPVVVCATELADCTAEIVRSAVGPGGQRPTASIDEAYNPCGLILSSAVDDGPDGFVDTTTTYTYASDNYLLSYEIVISSQGYGSFTASGEYSYNPDGSIASFGYDSDGDGVSDVVTTYTYDGKGQLVSSLTDDGSSTLLTTFSFTGDDTAGTITTDYGDDGQADLVMEYLYGATQAEFWHDDDGDGTWDWYRLVTYDGDGRVVTDDTDDGVDGRFERLQSWVYDGDGRVSQHTTDDDGDGDVDQIEAYTWVCP